MLLEKIKTPGLAHLSYVIGADGKAAVIDPRRDCEVYVEKARANGLEITHIFETHRNEDLISGAPILAKLTDAVVIHGPDAEGVVEYARTTREGETFEIGSLTIEVLETPGHTDDHVAYVVYDQNFDDGAVGVFTGDALFVGDVGRTDFYPDRAEEVAGLLYDSLRKILALGDQTIIYPAHGAGSVCGSAMAAREFSTVGHERKNNPRLQITSRDEFIRVKTEEVHYSPPYFKLMERLNLVGGSAAERILYPKILSLKQFDSQDADVIVDVREPAAYAAGHLPGAMSLPVGMIAAFAGWFISQGERIILVANEEEELRTAAAHLSRIGLDNVLGGYVGVVEATAQGHGFKAIPMIDTATVEERLKSAKDDWTLIDVRAADEVEERRIEQSQHIYVGHLNEEWQSLDRDQSYTLMCGSGKRATVAAGWLASRGFANLDIYLGSIGAWSAAHD